MKNPSSDKIMVTPEELEQVRKILGDKAKDMTDNELIDQIAAMKFLSETWLDDYEKSIFNGKTLNEKISNT